MPTKQHADEVVASQFQPANSIRIYSRWFLSPEHRRPQKLGIPFRTTQADARAAFRAAYKGRENLTAQATMFAVQIPAREMEILQRERRVQRVCPGSEGFCQPTVRIFPPDLPDRNEEHLVFPNDPDKIHLFWDETWDGIYNGIMAEASPTQLMIRA